MKSINAITPINPRCIRESRRRLSFEVFVGIPVRTHEGKSLFKGPHGNCGIWIHDFISRRCCVGNPFVVNTLLIHLVLHWLPATGNDKTCDHEVSKHCFGSQRIREWQLSVLAAPVVHDVFGDERTQSQTFIKLAQQQQTTVGSDPRSLVIDSQRVVEGELKGLVLLLTHWVEASTILIVLSKPQHTGVDPIIRPLTRTSKRKCGLRPGGQKRFWLLMVASRNRQFF